MTPQTVKPRPGLAARMPEGRRDVRASRCTGPRAITFALTGRTTLSEHLPSENINVALRIATRSPFLRALVEQYESRDQPTDTIDLRNADPTGFKLYIEWLNTRRVTYPFRSGPYASSGLTLRDCIDLIYAHIVGSQFGEAEFQDYVIDEIARRLDTAQTPDVKVFEIIFVDKNASNILKRFVVDKMFALERKMVGMLKGSVQDVPGSNGCEEGCEYHVHEEGKCSRGMSKQKSIDSGNRAQESWNAYENPGLNSTTSHYLGAMHESHELAEPRPEPSTNREVISGKQTLVPLQKMIYAPDLHYFGSAAWSREVHGLQSNTRPSTTHAILDKLLPPLPPPIPNCSLLLPPQVSFLHTPYFSRVEKYEAIKPVSTQTLIAECLQRLSSTSADTPTQTLISECLGRLAVASSKTMAFPQDQALSKKPWTATSPSSSDSLRSTISVTASPSEKSSPDQGKDLNITSLGKTSLGPDSASVTLPPPSRVSSASTSNTVLALSSPKIATPPLSSFPHTPSLSSPTTVPSASIPFLAQIKIKRKPVPPRGLDWLEQWERLNALGGTQDSGLKSSDKIDVRKRSRFTKMLGSVRDC